jgi:Glycosyl transferase family 2
LAEAKMSCRVFAIASVYENADLVPHFLAHYTRLGVHRILLVVRTPQQDDNLSVALEQAKSYGANVYWFSAERFADSDKAEVEQFVLRENRVEPDDYVMHLDLDEFQEYPASLSEIVDAMNQADDWALRGWIVDRVAERGVLAPIRPIPSIGEQYPIGCDLTKIILQAWTQKIVLCRGRVQLRGGARHDTCNAYYDRVPIGHPDQYVVHHFKWTAGVFDRIRERLHTAAVGSAYESECQRCLKYFDSVGRIDLSDPALRARPLGAINYPRSRLRLVRLFLNPYSDLDPARDAELRQCRDRNASHPLIAEVRTLSGRPTFAELFAVVNECTDQQDVNIIANADIYFDDSLEAVTSIGLDECYALSRWDDTEAGLRLSEADDSQDAWVFRGRIRSIAAPFTMGVPGCDNRLAYLLSEAGYRLSNPSRSIRAIHLHRSSVRRYGYGAESLVPGPYKRLAPTEVRR